MPAHDRRAERGAARGRTVIAAIAREIRDARLERGLSQATIARASGIERSRISRIERARIESVSVLDLCRLLGVLGLELSARVYPSGGPIRDAAHLAVLRAFRRGLHRTLRFDMEIPLPGVGDLRAWDGLVTGPGWRVGVEAETAPRDLQALLRRLALKQRDGAVDAVLLLLRDSRRNRTLLRDHADAFRSFEQDGLRVLAALAAGRFPGGDGVALIAVSRSPPARPRRPRSGTPLCTTNTNATDPRVRWPLVGVRSQRTGTDRA